MTPVVSETRPLARAVWLARRLSVSRHRAYQLMRERRVPGVVRIGRQIRVDPEAVESWISGGGSPLATD